MLFRSNAVHDQVIEAFIADLADAVRSGRDASSGGGAYGTVE